MRHCRARALRRLPTQPLSDPGRGRPVGAEFAIRRLPQLLLEALACGTPVVATPAPGGVREILDGVAGCIVADALDRWQPSGVAPDAVAPYAVERIVAAYEAEFLRDA